MVAGTIILANWDPRYLNILRKLVNVPSPVNTDTALAVIPNRILLDHMSDSDAGATSVSVSHTVYVPPPFVPILLASKLSPFEAWQRLGVRSSRQTLW